MYSAQWFRDSTNQLLPYLPYASQDDGLRKLVCGLVRRHSRDVAWDPCASDALARCDLFPKARAGQTRMRSTSPMRAVLTRTTSARPR
jgi:meiotically up-regulated gene 157 (Mug157) protein